MALLLSLSVIVFSSSCYHLHISTFTIRQASFKGPVQFVCRRRRTNKQDPFVKFRSADHTGRLWGIGVVEGVFSLICFSFLSIVFDANSAECPMAAECICG